MTADEEEVLDTLIGEFRDKIEEDDSVRKKMEKFEREVQIDFNSGNIYNLELKDGDVSEFEEGALENAEIKIETDVETLRDILEGEASAMQAYAKGKIKVDAPLTDMMKFKKLL